MTSKDFKGSIFVEFENQETAERVRHAAACCDPAHLPEHFSNAYMTYITGLPLLKLLLAVRCISNSTAVGLQHGIGSFQSWWCCCQCANSNLS